MTVRKLVLAALLAFAAPNIAWAQLAAVIRSVTPSGGVLTITGENFIQPRGRFDVLLGSIPLTPTSYTNNTIVAPLPGPLSVGTYLVDLVPQRGVSAAGDEFPYVVAAAGAKGDKGDKGDTGAQGPQGIQGAMGPQGAQGVPGPQGVQGIQGSTGATGSQGPSGTTGMSSTTFRLDSADLSTSDYGDLITLPVSIPRLPADVLITFDALATRTNGGNCSANYLISWGDRYNHELFGIDVGIATNGGGWGHSTFAVPAAATGTMTILVQGYAANCPVSTHYTYLTATVIPH